MAIEGNDYANNDHVALCADLALIHGEGFRVRPLHEIVRAWLHEPHSLEGEPLVALTCDDGADFDYRDLPHPVAGMQRSFLNILRDFTASHRDVPVHMTSFVIVSPAARELLDVKCMVGLHWWNDDWWAAARDSGHLGIANHSWDHNHDALAGEAFPGVDRGTFRNIDTLELAEYQIAAAGERLRAHAPGPSAELFAYPYGESNRYLIEEYFPRHSERIRVAAAFGVEAAPMSRAGGRWNLPRYMFRKDWDSPEGLRRILAEARR
jgi:peptidoglycan/xylan/chitin deacetylase (PgdA/CDA1 family)